MKVLRNLMLGVTFFSALALPSATYAQFVDGNKLKSWSDAKDRMERGTSSDPVSDLTDSSKYGAYLWGYFDGVGFIIHCSPEGLTGTQLMAIVTNYLQDHPEQWTDAGGDIVRAALHQAFPCPDSNP